MLDGFFYPITWWILLFVIDTFNFRRWKESLLRTHLKFLFGIIVPLSISYWLYFEFANLYFPQWYYVGLLPGVWTRTILSMLSFSTVIPAVAEILWLFAGPNLVASAEPAFRKWTASFIAIGLALAIAPFFAGNILVSAVIWIWPFLILLPFSAYNFFNSQSLLFISLAGLANGFLWEFLNFWAPTKWKYLVLPDSAHLFEMPILGYLGFIPFAFSTIALYLFAKRFLKPKPALAALLYILAFAASYFFAIS